MARRPDGAGVQIVERDLHAVELAALHGWVTAKLFRQALFGNENATYRRLKMLVDAGYLRHDRVFHGRGGVYRATRKGLRLVGLELPPAGLDVADLAHDLAVAELSLRVVRAAAASAGTATWITEREIRHADMRLRREKDTGRMLPGRQQVGKIPDGLLVGPGGERIAIELEIAPKANKRYRQILIAYAYKHRGDLPEVRRPAPTRSEHVSDFVGSGGTVDGVALYSESPAVQKRLEVLVAEILKGRYGSNEPKFFLLDSRAPKYPRMTKLQDQIKRDRDEEERLKKERRERERQINALRLTQEEVEHALNFAYEAKNSGRRLLRRSLMKEEEDRALRDALESKRARTRATLQKQETRPHRRTF